MAAGFSSSAVHFRSALLFVRCRRCHHVSQAILSARGRTVLVGAPPTRLDLPRQQQRAALSGASGAATAPPIPAAAFTLPAHHDAATTLEKPPEEHPPPAPAPQAAQLACKVSPSCIVTYMLRDRSPAR